MSQWNLTGRIFSTEGMKAMQFNRPTALLWGRFNDQRRHCVPELICSLTVLHLWICIFLWIFYHLFAKSVWQYDFTKCKHTSPVILQDCHSYYHFCGVFLVVFSLPNMFSYDVTRQISCLHLAFLPTLYCKHFPCCYINLIILIVHKCITFNTLQAN